jgi:diguanylate cyclase (GGDEF)-like protein
VVEKDPYTILKELLQVTSPFIREKFLEQCVAAIVRLLGADFAFISRTLDAPARRVRVLAAWESGAKKDDWDFDLSGTPCDLVYDSAHAPLVGAHLLDGGRVIVAEEVCQKFPATRNTRYQGFVGVPLWNRQGEMVGHVATFFVQKLQDGHQAELIVEILQLIAHRAEAELDRMQMESAMQRTNEDLQRANARLLKDSSTDPLTQVPNRRYFNQRCKEAFARFRRSGERYFLLLLDVDHFKAINDCYGHDTGDQVLRGIAAAMGRNVRDGAELVARLGGEEFAVVCNGVDRAEFAAAVAERIRAEIAERPLTANGQAIPVTVSIGVAGPAAEDQTWEDAYRRADRALYAAKDAGRNRVSIEGA